MSGRKPFPAGIAALAVLIAGCSSERGDGVAPPPAAEGAVPQLSLVAGQPLDRTYANACGTCHDNGGFGVRVLADRLGAERALIHRTNDLHPDAIRAIVRNGMGAMPAMSKLEVSDAELDGIIVFLGKVRRGGGAGG